MASSNAPLPERTSLTPTDIGPDGFIPEVVLDTWTRRGRAQRAGGVLRLGDDQVHDVVDAVRILGRRNGESDPYGWTGRVFPLRELLRLGAAIGPDGARLGSAAYDVEFGVVVETQPASAPEPGGPLGPSRPSTGSGLFADRGTRRVG